MAQQHNPATLSIQRRLERWELDHLRAMCAVQAEEIEHLKLQLTRAEDSADMWHRAHEHLANHLDEKNALGLTLAGDVMVVKGGAA